MNLGFTRFASGIYIIAKLYFPIIINF